MRAFVRPSVIACVIACVQQLLTLSLVSRCAWLIDVFGAWQYRTDKLSLPLVVHHSIMLMGFITVQHPWAHCYVWIVVHVQLVHIPFALRAVWRLLMPELRLALPGSLLRDAVDATMWASWMTIVVYRTSLVVLYCFWAHLVVNLGLWALLALVLVSGIGMLDKGWTEAMWPKPNDVGPTFVLRVRLFAALGLILSVLVWACDTYPQHLSGLLDVLPTRAHMADTPACLIAQRTEQ